ncbi:DUF393 domain-containing protein [Dasania sp. GY-MA-18]|uniref:DUF393 domain-containing protein n=1 Tax=Dasania phycosphaerae TaxID=2950436 RepID=A0A9J6RI56_9GAMM|nr:MULTISPECIES: DUF393 domain-containing protein [Dasania]MCR8921688.1 DUF393 domain-containing protein [Dasania sp. GY-MA-18]MCZ0864116.1 DUF393 domain-containing protein [Dasania phycosphaerae]MCZ0867844.1 DUF393 domain-containing protein [Dasania phycosphaerae]
MPKITVYYDGSCPSCVRDRCNYEKWAGDNGKDVQWLDITDREDLLNSKGINPQKALTELHIEIDNQQILSEMDAYIVLMAKVPRLKALAWLLNLAPIKKIVSKIYHWQVTRRLKRQGRL